MSLEKITDKKFGEIAEFIYSRALGSRLFTSVFPGSSKSFLIKKLSEKKNQIVLLFEDKNELYETNVELEILGVKSTRIIADETSGEAGQKIIGEINSNGKFILLALADVLKMKFPQKKSVEQNTLKIRAGSELEYEEFLEFLNLYNYDRESFVEIPGTYAMRGAVIDFWSYSERNPARVEFDGDFIESIRYFDAESQRSTGHTEEVTLAPRIFDEEENLSATLFDFLSEPVIYADSLIIDELTGKENANETAAEVTDDLDEELAREIFDEITDVETPEEENVNIASGTIDENELFRENALWVIEDKLQTASDIYRHGLKSAPSFESNFKLLAEFFIRETASGKRIFITTENELQLKRLEELFSELDEKIKTLIEEGRLKLTVLPIKSGFEIPEEKTVILSDYRIFGKPYRKKISRKQKRKKSRTKELASLKRGDFVVHENFGIGKYEGLEKIKIGAVEQESLKISYAEGDVVYVNLNYLGLVKKFSSKEGVAPKVTKLGSPEWQTTKKKVKKRIKDAARDLIKLYAQRKASPGFQFSADSVWQMELEASFYYEDTPDQAKVTEEVKKDMESEHPMDRLVCGDVGFGKTEIAVRAAFKAVNDGKQVALLVPTTILAEQHFNTFRDRLGTFPVRVETLSRFVTRKKQNEILQELAEGKVDIVIGTHRLLSKDVKFKDLGLLIIDEEHRFGVMAKEKLRKLRVNIDTLTLTATPIPRTLNLSLLGARDLSIIATPPPNRQPIYTQVDVFDIKKIREWITKEKNRGGQIFFVHDRVQSIDKIASYLKKHIPDVTFEIAHGQMKPAELEKVIFDFMNRKFDMLISTKIIESGIDIPNVNTIIVNRADRFGLAELHQLRGRVGRADKKAYAYFLVPSLKAISKKAIKRLQALEEYSGLGEGFNLSMRDLEIRGAGNLLGEEQSGAINAVGFDLYLKLLDEAIAELKRDEFKEELKDLPQQLERAETVVDTYFEIGIPKNYMENQSDRLSFYTSLFSIVNEDEIPEIIDEMKDRFGAPPEETKLMVAVAEIKFHASLLQSERVVITERKIAFVLPKLDKAEFYETKFAPLVSAVTRIRGNRFQIIQKKDSVKLEFNNDSGEPAQTLKFVLNFLKELRKEVAQMNN